MYIYIYVYIPLWARCGLPPIGPVWAASYRSTVGFCRSFCWASAEASVIMWSGFRRVTCYNKNLLLRSNATFYTDLYNIFV